jgi:hypothetical protein
MDALSKKNNGKEVRRVLTSLPEKLDLTYDEAIQRIQRQNKDDCSLAIRTLMWITTAYRHLTFEELQQAVSIDPEDRELHTLADGYTDSEVLLSRCAGLVFIESSSGTVRLIRKS